MLHRKQRKLKKKKARKLLTPNLYNPIPHGVHECILSLLRRIIPHDVTTWEVEDLSNSGGPSKRLGEKKP